jgi:predicted transcriptional regulator
VRPTDSELEILHILWQRGPSTVRTVNDALNTRREVGYTTTLKLLQIMHEKGLATRQEEGRTHVYAAAVTQEETQSVLLQQFVDAAFRGSAMKLVMQALGNHEASAAELDEIKALINQLEQSQQTPDANSPQS